MEHPERARSSSSASHNYVNALNDPIFIRAIQNTIYYAVVWVPLTMAIGLFLAIIVNQKIRGQTFFRAAYYFPAIASSAAITMLWIFLVAPVRPVQRGPRGARAERPVRAASATRRTRTGWATRTTALNSVIILNAWTTSGTFMLFYLASLQSISNEVYEAAAIDGAAAGRPSGASRSRCCDRAITSSRRSRVIGALQLFDQAAIAGGPGGDPANSLMTIVLYLYNAAFTQLNFSYAAAVGIILFVVIFGATLVQRRLFGQAPSW